MIKFNKKSLYFYGKNREFSEFLKSMFCMDITLEKLLKIKSLRDTM